MLKLNQQLSLEENDFIKFGTNVYQISTDYNGIEGKLDLSDYDDLVIIIPETIQYFGTMCITCNSNSPSKSTIYHKHHKLIFNHLSLANVVFELFCFDGITTFEVKTNAIKSQLPNFISSYPYTMITSDNTEYCNNLANQNIINRHNKINNKIDILKTAIDNYLKQKNDKNETLASKKYDILKIDSAESKIDDIIRLFA